MNHESELLDGFEEHLKATWQKLKDEFPFDDIRRYTKRAEILKKHLPDENVPDMIFFSQQECYELMVKEKNIGNISKLLCITETHHRL